MSRHGRHTQDRLGPAISLIVISALLGLAFLAAGVAEGLHLTGH